MMAANLLIFALLATLLSCCASAPKRVEVAPDFYQHPPYSDQEDKIDEDYNIVRSYGRPPRPKLSPSNKRAPQPREGTIGQLKEGAPPPIGQSKYHPPLRPIVITEQETMYPEFILLLRGFAFFFGIWVLLALLFKLLGREISGSDDDDKPPATMATCVDKSTIYRHRHSN
jgi:hypothetical protein